MDNDNAAYYSKMTCILYYVLCNYGIAGELFHHLLFKKKSNKSHLVVAQPLFVRSLLSMCLFPEDEDGR